MRYFLSFVFVGVLCSGGFAQTPAENGELIRIPLEFQQDGLTYVQRRGTRHDFVFEKEPTYAGRDVRRGAFPCGIPFALDVQGKRLYIDANRNMDLTDDHDHVYTTSNDEWPFEFKGVRLPREDAREPRLVDITFTDGIEYYRFRSGLTGTVEIAEREFAIAAHDNLDSQDFGLTLMIRPADCEQAPQRLCVDGYLGVSDRVYEITLEQHGLNVQVVFSEVTEKTVAMFIDAHAVRLSEADDRSRVSSTFYPDKVLRLPETEYKLEAVFLKDGDRVLHALPRVWFTASDGAVFNFGPPLRERISARRIANRLEFTHQITGKGGEAYRILFDETDCGPIDTPEGMPVLTVRQDDKVLLTGIFAVKRYG